MAIKSSGSIKFSDIKKEFGDSNGSTAGVSLGKYRVSEDYGEMTNMPLDEGMPQSGAIGMSDFYGKKLNIVVNYYSGGTEHLPESGKQRYQKQGHPQSECVGEFKAPPQQTTGSKVWIHVNKTIGSSGATQSQNVCAFKTGNWQGNTDLRVHVGNEGYIRGKGGQGGSGGDGGSETGQAGSPGTSAIGIEFSNGTTILTGNNSAIAAGGGGGGGGGGAARQEDRGNDRKAGGGGGGGGFGLPIGQGGDGGDGEGRYASGGGGQKGTVTSQGQGAAGGGGGDNDGEARAGNGGRGGVAGAAGQGGDDGEGNKESGGQSQGGAGGNWIRTGGNSVQSQGWQGQSQGQYSSGTVS